MEIEDNNCTICSKICTIVFSAERSLIYFNLLNEIYGSIPNFTQNEDILQKNICIECAHNIDTVSKFINTLNSKNIDSEISPIHCRLCEEETDELYTQCDLPNDLQEKMQFFVKIVLNNKVFEPSWKICLPCVASIIFWSDYRKMVVNNEKSDKISDTSEIVESRTSELNSVIIEDANNEEKSVERTTLSLNESLSHVKSVSDYLTFKDLWKLKYEVVTNKQLMVDKPYIRLKKCNFEDYTCSWCRKAFSTVYKATMHELRHGKYFLPKVVLDRIPSHVIESKLHSKSKRTSCKEKWYYNILPVCETVYSDDENLDQNSNLSETVKNDVIVIDDNDNTTKTNQIVDNNHEPNLTSVQKSNYLGAFNNWLTTTDQKHHYLNIIPQSNGPPNLTSVEKSNYLGALNNWTTNEQRPHHLNNNLQQNVPLNQNINGQVIPPQQVYKVGQQTTSSKPTQFSIGQINQPSMLLRGPNGQLFLCQRINLGISQTPNNLLQPEMNPISQNIGTHFLANSEPRQSSQINNLGTHFLASQEPKLSTQINNLGTLSLASKEPKLSDQRNNVGTHFLANKDPTQSVNPNLSNHFLAGQEPKLSTQINNLGTPFLASNEPKLSGQRTHFLANNPTQSVNQTLSNHVLANQEPNSQIDQDKIQRLQLLHNQNLNSNQTNVASTLSDSPREQFLVFRQANGVVSRIKIAPGALTQIPNGIIRFPMNLNSSQGPSTSQATPNLNNLGTSVPVSNSVGTESIHQIPKNTSTMSQNLVQSSSSLGQTNNATRNSFNDTVLSSLLSGSSMTPSSSLAASTQQSTQKPSYTILNSLISHKTVGQSSAGPNLTSLNTSLTENVLGPSNLNSTLTTLGASNQNLGVPRGGEVPPLNYIGSQSPNMVGFSNAEPSLTTLGGPKSQNTVRPSSATPNLTSLGAPGQNTMGLGSAVPLLTNIGSPSLTHTDLSLASLGAPISQNTLRPNSATPNLTSLGAHSQNTMDLSSAVPHLTNIRSSSQDMMGLSHTDPSLAALGSLIGPNTQNVSDAGPSLTNLGAHSQSTMSLSSVVPPLTNIGLPSQNMIGLSNVDSTLTTLGALGLSNADPNLTNLGAPGQNTVGLNSGVPNLTNQSVNAGQNAPVINDPSMNSIRQTLLANGAMPGSNFHINQAKGNPFTICVPEVLNNSSYGCQSQNNNIDFNTTQNKSSVLNNDLSNGIVLKDMLNEKLKLLTNSETEKNKATKTKEALRVRTDLF